MIKGLTPSLLPQFTAGPTPAQQAQAIHGFLASGGAGGTGGQGGGGYSPPPTLTPAQAAAISDVLNHLFTW